MTTEISVMYGSEKVNHCTMVPAHGNRITDCHTELDIIPLQSLAHIGLVVSSP